MNLTGFEDHRKITEIFLAIHVIVLILRYEAKYSSRQVFQASLGNSGFKASLNYMRNKTKQFQRGDSVSEVPHPSRKTQVLIPSTPLKPKCDAVVPTWNPRTRSTEVESWSLLASQLA